VRNYSDLHAAAKSGNLEEVRFLILAGADVNSFDELGYTALHYAVREENLQIATCLLDAGCDVDAHDPQLISNTPLGDIAGNCSLEMARLLIRYGADPAIPGWMQMTALDRAKERKRGDGPAVYKLLAERARTI
jgi:ankyrin repeat protein